MKAIRFPSGDRVGLVRLGVQGGQPLDVLSRRVQDVDRRLALPRRGPGDELAVGRPRGPAVPGPVVGQRRRIFGVFDRLLLHPGPGLGDRVHLGRKHPHQVEVLLPAAVGLEDDGRAVGRPGGPGVVAAAGRQALLVLAVRADGVDLPGVVPVGHVYDAPPARRPGRREVLVIGPREHFHFRVPEVQAVMAVALRREDQGQAVGSPGGRLVLGVSRGDGNGFSAGRVDEQEVAPGARAVDREGDFRGPGLRLLRAAPIGHGGAEAQGG